MSSMLQHGKKTEGRKPSAQGDAARKLKLSAQDRGRPPMVRERS